MVGNLSSATSALRHWFYLEDLITGENRDVVTWQKFSGRLERHWKASLICSSENVFV